MNRLAWLGPLALGLLLLAGGRSQAQINRYQPPPVSPFYTPAISPYLNMLIGGNTAVNYYLRVLPDFQQGGLNAQYNQQLQYLNQRSNPTSEASVEPEDLLPTSPGTGHGVQFMNLSPYYVIRPFGNQTSTSRSSQSSVPKLPGRK